MAQRITALLLALAMMIALASPAMAYTPTDWQKAKGCEAGAKYAHFAPWLYQRAC